MLKLAILDDDLAFATQLSKKVKNLWAEVDVIVYQDLQALERIQYQVLFLDIELKQLGQSGFTIANSVKEQCDIPIVFITSHQEYALDGYRYRPFGFVWKVQLDQRLPSVIEELKTYFQRKALDMCVQDENGIQRHLQISEIRYFYKDGNYVVVHTDIDYRMSTSVKKLFEELLEKQFSNFFTPLNGYVVNMFYITKIDKRNLMLYIDRMQIPIGMHHIKPLLKKMNEVSL